MRRLPRSILHVAGVPRCRLPVLLRSRWIPFSPLARCLAFAPRVPHCHLPDGLWLPLPQDLCASWWKIREGRQVSPTASLLRCSFAFLSHDQVEKLMGERRDEAEAEAAAKIMELCAAVGDRSSAKVTPKRPSGILHSPRARPCSNGATGSWPLSWCWAWRQTRRRGALRCPAPRRSGGRQ